MILKRVFSVLKRLLFVEPNLPEMLEGEHVVRAGTVVLTKGLIGARAGRLVLTNRRLFWGETTRPVWPMKPITGQIELSDVAGADKGTFLDFIAGGRPLRLRLRNGKNKCFSNREGKLDDWVSAIREALDQGTRE